MPLTNDNMHLAARLWQAVLDAFQMPEHQLEISMSTPDPVQRMHFVQDLLLGQEGREYLEKEVRHHLPEVQFRGGDWMPKGTKRT